MTVQEDYRIILAKNVLTMLRWREEYHRKNGNIDMCIAYGSSADMLQYALNEDADCLAQYDYSHQGIL